MGCWIDFVLMAELRLSPAHHPDSVSRLRRHVLKLARRVHPSGKSHRIQTQRI
jgi:hypothetical protein